MVISKTHLSECMKIAKKRVINIFSFKLACVDDADEKMHFANLLEMPLKRPF